jgi:hypothetical protein
MQRSVAAKCVGNLSDAAGKSPKHRQCSAFDTVTEAVSRGLFLESQSRPGHFDRRDTSPPDACRRKVAMGGICLSAQQDTGDETRVIRQFVEDLSGVRRK